MNALRSHHLFRALGLVQRSAALGDAVALAVPRTNRVAVRGIAGARPLRNEEAAKKDASAEEAATAGASEAGTVTIDGKELEQLKEKVTELQDKLLRSLAEIENTRHRAKQDVDNARKFGIQGFAKGLVDVADVLGLALKSVPAEVREDTSNPWVKNLYFGIEATEKELLKVFQQNGLAQFDPLGEKFDPHLHDALCEVDDPAKDPGTVAFVDKVGYSLNDRIIRAAKVGVVRKR